VSSRLEEISLVLTTAFTVAFLVKPPTFDETKDIFIGTPAANDIIRQTPKNRGQSFSTGRKRTMNPPAMQIKLKMHIHIILAFCMYWQPTIPIPMKITWNPYVAIFSKMVSSVPKPIPLIMRLLNYD
jgi:hypothetical protein